MSSPAARIGSRVVRVLGSPLVWLLLQLSLSSWFLATTGGLDYRRVPDTASYLEVTEIESFSVALAQYRSLGYPAYLELFRTTDDSIPLGRAVAVQWGLFAAAIVLFFAAVARSTGARWLALAAASPLIYSPLRLLVDRVQPDFLAAAAIITSFGLLFLLLERTTSTRWAAFGVVVFLSYQLRPAGLFLVALLPLVAALSIWIGRRAEPSKALEMGARIALVTVLPLLAFSGLRALAVGHFGVVSFGGFNGMGVAACFLDHRLINQLPEGERPLARAIFRARNARGYEPLTRGDDPRDFFEQYSPNIFSISAQAARWHQRSESRARRDEQGAVQRAKGPPLDWPLEVNRRLSRLARAIIVRRPVLYANWIRSALVYGVEQLGDWLWITLPTLALLLLVPLRLLRGAAPRAESQPDPEGGEARRYFGTVLLAVSAGGLFVAYLAAVSLVSYPFQRYLLSMILLLPTALWALLFEIVRSLVPATGSASGG